MLYRQMRPPYWQRHPWLTGIAALLVVWQLLVGSYALVAASAVVGLAILLKRRRRAIALRDAGLRARAEFEHRLSLAGDPRGVFGRYPPVQAGWFPDPQSRFLMRYFDGASWTPYAAPR